MSHPNSLPGATHRPLALTGLRTPLLLASAGAVLLFASLGRAPGLEAQSNQCMDADDDGLVDDQEEILGTDPDLDDTDGDGYADTMELARGSNPLRASSVPGSEELGVGMFARATVDSVTTVSAIYVEDGKLGDIDFQFGMVMQKRGRPLVLDQRRILSSSSIRIFRVQDSKVVLLETTFSARAVRRFGTLSLFGTVSRAGTIGLPAAASTLNLTDFGGVPTAIEPFDPGPGADGMIYRPLVPSRDLDPGDFNGSQVCFQASSTVGSNGMSSINEVDAAGCEPLDSSCHAAACAELVGEQFSFVDPAALTGG